MDTTAQHQAMQSVERLIEGLHELFMVFHKAQRIAREAESLLMLSDEALVKRGLTGEQAIRSIANLLLFGRRGLDRSEP